MKHVPLGQHPPLDIKDDCMPDLRLRVPASRPPLPEATLAAALKRTEAAHIPAQREQLNALAWFVELAQWLELHNTDLRHMSPADILTKQEEFAALERQLQVRHSPPLPSKMDLRLLSIGVKDALDDLRHKHETRLGPFFMSVHIVLPTKPSSANPVDRARDVSDFNRAIGAPSFLQDRAEGRNGLMREFAGLLKKYLTSIRCCPGCEMVFVQPRKNAEYCSRKCQNKHYMQTERDIANEKKRAAEALKLKRKTHKKGRAPHGTKTHR